MLNNLKNELPIPPLTSQQVEEIINFANTQMPMIFGKQIIAFIENIAFELEKNKTNETETTPQSS